MKKFLFALSLSVLVGCSTLVPKKVEFFQDKVHQFPEQSAALVELERQALARAYEKTTETVEAAIAESASTKVVVPAKEAQVLTKAVATVIGPPLKPAPVSVASTNLAVKLETAEAKFEKKVAAFKVDNNENVGKKIEGTGVVQIGYFYWIGGIIGAVVLILFVGKLALSIAAMANPGAAIGLNAVNVATAVASKGFAQIVKGGEDFKDWISKEISDAGVKEKILTAFRASQTQAQDHDVQNVVAALTK